MRTFKKVISKKSPALPLIRGTAKFVTKVIEWGAFTQPKLVYGSSPLVASNVMAVRVYQTTNKTMSPSVHINKQSAV